MQPNTGLRDAFLWCLFLSGITGAALQQPAYNAFASSDRHLSVADNRFQAQDSLQTPLSGQHLRDPLNRDTRHKDRSRTRTSHNERALATFAPAGSAVRAFPPAPTSSAASSTAGLTSRQPARSLQDWQVEDIILLATVDGKLHARDRTTGAPRWAVGEKDGEKSRPMVETIYHRHNRSVDEAGIEQEDAIWIVEPSRDGSIYIYVPNSGFGMQKLGYTVKELADLAPYASEGPPAVAYTAEKKNELYTIDAATGDILKVFSSSGSKVNDSSCQRINPLENPKEDECLPIGTLTIARTEWTISIQDRNTEEPITTIRFFEWVPNNRDQDLKSKYTATMDGKYIYTRHDGSVYGVDLTKTLNMHSLPGDKSATYRQQLDAPVARAFDVVRPSDDQSSDASLVVLPQPIGPSFDELDTLDDDAPERIWVNCTERGSCYALSEANYPAIAMGAQTAECYNDEYFFNMPASLMSKMYRDKFVGIHYLFSAQGQKQSTPMIGAPQHPGIEAPPDGINESYDAAPIAIPSWYEHLLPIRAFFTVLAVGLMAGGFLYAHQNRIFAKDKDLTPLSAAVPAPITTTELRASDKQLPQTPKLRQGEPATETIFPHDSAENVQEADVNNDGTPARVEIVDAAEEEGVEVGKDAVTKPKGHKRGKRGGRKQKEKEQAAADARAKRNAVEILEPAEVISVAASESPQVSGPLRINSLIVHTDRVIGQGSCGTCVFAGSFEGRDVAVKRMLSQYYELASQEVSFLQQSDDHPNVVRYFCQQKDDHFLYIAVELCQASLFEVWEAEKARDEERQQQLIMLKRSIQQDTPRALQQLAAGLHHLHNLRIIHRDIKPQNILVAYPKRHQSGGPRLVISDFGLGKNLPENVSTLVDPTGNAGTSGWKAPELISQPRETDSKHSQSSPNTHGGSDSANSSSGPSGVKRAADIFSLGCLFFWVLTDGIHPYEDENGWQQLRELNIKRDNKKMEVLERWSDAYEPMQLITSMLEHQPENRPTALQVLNHPFFWLPEKRLAFLCDCSDHFEREPRGLVEDGYAGDSVHLSLLEDRAKDVIGEGRDFLAKLDRQFVDTLGKQRKYSGSRLLDLLRALRNKKNHYEDMPEDVKKRVGALAGGYLSYWTTRFPRLLMACYDVIHEADIQSLDRFKGYFTS